MKKKLDACRRLGSNREKTERAAGDPGTAASCREQIRHSVDLCLVTPAETEAERNGALSARDVDTQDMQVTLRQQLGAYGAGGSRFVNSAAQCRDETKMVTQACNGAEADLKSALRDNGRHLTEAQSALARGMGPERADNLERVRTLNDTSQQLQNQMRATQTARRTALGAIDEAEICFDAQGAAYAAAGVKVQETIDKIQADAPENSGQSLPIQNVSLTSGATEPKTPPSPAPKIEDAPPSTWASLGSKTGEVAVSAFGVVGGKIGSPVNAALAGQGGDYWSAAQNAAGTASPFFESRALGLLGGLPGTAAVQIMAPTPAGDSCDGDRRNPAAAAATGCPLNMSTSRAIAILRSP